jgi:PST family polysaccharide transporter
MTLFRTSVLSALAVLTKLATSLFLNKVLAIYVGTAGYGVIGQFQSLIAMVTTFASGATNSGVTKYTAEYAANLELQRAVWRTAAMMGLLGALVFGLVLILVRKPLSLWLLGSEVHSDVLVWLALVLGLLVMNGLMLAIMNGRKAVREFVAANIVGSVVSAIVATGLVATSGLWGALVALATSQAVACGFTAWLFHRVCHVRWRELFGKIDPVIAKSLGGFALMAATTALVAPVGQMIIRDQIASNLGWDSAGLWQALWKISETHLLLLTSTLSVYFLPRFSEINSGQELRREVMKGYLFVLPMVAASGLILYNFRDTLIRVLLSAEFMPLAQVLGLQLLGDALKISSWVMSFTMVSHARTRAFVVTEILFTAIFVIATVLLSKYYGLAGSAIAYAGTYFIYWIVMYWLFKGLIRRLQP